MHTTVQYLLWATLYIVAFSVSAAAQEKTVVGSACTTGAAAFDWDAMFQCVGGTWQRSPMMIGTNGTCSTSTVGSIQYGNSQLQFCNGTSWVSAQNIWTTSGSTAFYNTGSIGIGTASPQASLDINGTLKLALNSAQPTTCSSANQGTLALNHLAAVCVCNTANSWVFLLTGLACSW